MPIRIFHPDHGYVVTSDPDVIDEILKKGGIVGSIKADPAPKEEVVAKPQPKPMLKKHKAYGSR